MSASRVNADFEDRVVLPPAAAGDWVLERHVHGGGEEILVP
jgi:hypothetical protein